MRRVRHHARHLIRTFGVLPLLGCAALASSGAAHASGFALNEMSAASVGAAHAGGAAAAEDLGTIYYNPAGLARMSGKQFMVVGSPLRTSAKFNNAGSTSAAGTILGGGASEGWAVLPALYFAMDLAPRLRFGIGLHSPFGLKTEYDDGWVGRYQALTSDLKTANINPSIAYQLNDQLALGAGISAQYADVTLSQAIDFGSICLATLGLIPCVGNGFLPLANDGKATVKGNDWGFGFNLGVLLTPNASSRFGIAYRSRIRHKVSGNARYDKPAGLNPLLAGAPAFTDTAASADVTLPESLSVSGHVDITPAWALMGDISWMRWSRFNELRIRFANGAPDNVTPEQWRNTVRIAVAAIYRYNAAWKLRTGIAYDPTPVRDEFRTARIPDADRTWLALGVQFRPSPQDTWDLSYAHLFIKDSPVSRTRAGTVTQVGSYSSKVDILSIQYSRTF